MSKYDGMEYLTAPCIIESGTLVNPSDIKRLLADLCRVEYVHSLAGQVINQGQGFIQEIFCDSHQSTLITNNKIYINIQSFNYLQLSKTTDSTACFDLIQDNRRLRLIPADLGDQPQTSARNIDAETIEAMVAEVLSARLDVQLDDEDF